MNSSGGIDSYAKLMDDINFAMAGSASSVPSDAPDAPDASRTGQEVRLDNYTSPLIASKNCFL